jgi:7-carboxy-7-deazaguanine synthase
MTLDAILDRVRDIGTPLVEVTGGEPLAHPNAFVLVQRLIDAAFTVLVETSGAFDIAPLDPRAHTIMDLKCPGSGETERNRWENLDHLTGKDEIKFVIADRADYDWAVNVIRGHGLDERVRAGTLRALLLSPVWERMDFQELAEWVLADRLPVRYQIQLHKVIWGPTVTGV